MTELKVIVSGAVEGNFKIFFKQIEKIQEKHGPFEHLFCVGNFFGSNDMEWPDVVSGKIPVPLSTYVLGPNKREHVNYFTDGCTIAPNITCLGRAGTLLGSSNLKIAYLSGIESVGASPISFTKADAQNLIKRTSLKTVDILLTSQWPEGVTKYAKVPEKLDFSESKLVARVLKEIKPRYHFCGLSKVFYERLPYRNHKVLQETPTHATRFISLAPINNDKKERSLYAFKITPSICLNSKVLAAESGPVTENPFVDVGEGEINEFFYECGTSSQSTKRSSVIDRENGAKKERLTITQDSCWFCLGNRNVAKHLLISVGNYSYLALPKGGLVEEHLLILPIEHIDASIHLSKFAYEEIYKFKKALSRYFNDNEEDVIFFERNFSSCHLQIQAMPIPKFMTPKVKDTVFKLGAVHDMEFNELPEFSLIKQIVPENKPYFYFEIVENEKIKSKLLCIINKHMPIQFGRMVLASEDLLNLPNKVDWKACALEEKEERKLAEQFRNNFKPYDFSL